MEDWIVTLSRNRVLQLAALGLFAFAVGVYLYIVVSG